jgi:glycine cleavage system H protein
MLPWVYGFTWQTGNIVFLSIFYSVAAIIFATLGVAAVRTLRDLKSRRLEDLKWHVDFNDLPNFAKACRHVFTGDVGSRVCPNGFDCRKCEFHSELSRDRRARNSSNRTAPFSSANVREPESRLLGLDIPSDLMYHRGHTWVRDERDGTVTVGLDQFGERIIGEDADPELPAVGTVLSANGTGWSFRSGESRVRILSPVDGEVIALGGKDEGFYLRVKCGDDRDLRHLLSGDEVRPWILREFERLQTSLCSARTGISLADGGELVRDIRANYPRVDWDGIVGEMFLEQ